jgi:hypothetical protein
MVICDMYRRMHVQCHTPNRHINMAPRLACYFYVIKIYIKGRTTVIRGLLENARMNNCIEMCVGSSVQLVSICVCVCACVYSRQGTDHI